jgi:hypothetical protein
MMSCPLLGMYSLQTLVLQQPDWQHSDMTPILALQRCFHVRNCSPNPIVALQLCFSAAA